MLKDLLPLLKDTNNNKTINKSNQMEVLNIKTVYFLEKSLITEDYLQRGQIYEDVSVQAARPHQSVVQDICSVGGGKNNNVVRRSHSCNTRRTLQSLSQICKQLWNLLSLLTVHLHQQLVERLLLFRVGETGHVGGALLPHGVDLVDVNDAGGSRASLFEQTADPRGTETCAPITTRVTSEVGR